LRAAISFDKHVEFLRRQIGDNRVVHKIEHVVRSTAAVSSAGRNASLVGVSGGGSCRAPHTCRAVRSGPLRPRAFDEKIVVEPVVPAIIVVRPLDDIRQDIGGAKRAQNGQGKNRKHYASNLETLFINRI
jgi:hypothetical protein